MANIQCARCGATDDEASAGFTEDGLVCGRCLHGEQQADAAQMYAQVAAAAQGLSGGTAPGGLDGESAHRAAAEHAGAPATAAVMALEARGMRPKRTGVSRSVTTPLGTRMSAGYAETWTFPQALAVQASFATERNFHQVVKWFKKELQTGDAAFDERVYVQTSTPEATGALLGREEVRHLIGSIVERGGTVKIAGGTLEVEALWPEEEPGPRDEDLGARVALALLDD